MPAPDADRNDPPPYAQYRAPREDDAALVSPDWATQLRQLGDRTPRPAIELAGQPLPELSELARREVVRIAAETGGHGIASAGRQVANGPLVVSGHQPELFHPGVWFKNFALDALAKAAGGMGVHLRIDSDLCRTPSVTAPTGPPDSPRSATVPYDRAAAPRPHEERRVLDEAAWASFPDRLAEAAGVLCPTPLVGAIWADAESARAEGATLGEALSVARHRLERRHGSETLETPMSRVCDTPPFRRFAAELLLRCEASRTAYNAALADYRTAHGLRNAAQPLPDLQAEGGWCETPLWVWSVDNPTRRPLWAKPSAGGVALRDDAHGSWEGPTDPESLVDALGELRERGVKIRSRALATTLFCRLVLADLFLHGIGGAKYDQVTDRWSQRLLGVAPPPHATLTATLRLPIAMGLSVEDPAELQAALRRLRYHPEVGLPKGVADAACDAKRCWIETPKTAANAAERHAAIAAANEAMAAARVADRDALLDRLSRAEQDGRAAKLLGSREHPFCLFAERDIVPRLRRLAAIPKKESAS